MSVPFMSMEGDPFKPSLAASNSLTTEKITSASIASASKALSIFSFRFFSEEQVGDKKQSILIILLAERQRNINRYIVSQDYYRSFLRMSFIPFQILMRFS